jgi:acetyltransferase-like isoleucine patch superfamily enzyme
VAGSRAADLARRSARVGRRAVRSSADRLYSTLAGNWAARSAFDRQASPAPEDFAVFGEGSWVVPPAIVPNPERIELGALTYILEYSRLCVLDEREGGAAGAHLRLGDGVRLARFNTILCGTDITIGDDVSSSDYVAIIDTWRDPLAGGRELAGLEVPPAAPVVIGAGAYIGCNATICPGVSVGEGAYVGEGAVVIDDVPTRSVVYGNPATVVRSYDATAGRWQGPRFP